MLRRQQEFRVAAEYVARELAELAAIEKVVLFGSVAVPLEKEVPRFREYRKAGIAVWHECKDVDLAVWVSDPSDLRSLQHARSRAIVTLLEEREIGVAHHQVDMFLMEPGSDHYLGRLCIFGECPKGREECLAPGCGKIHFLQQHENFTPRRETFAASRSILLFQRGERSERKG